MRLGIEGATIRYARVTVGGVAPVPLRRENVEAALLGSRCEPQALDAAASLAADGAAPLAMTVYKLQLLRAVVRDALERAVA